jgi:hypothetical protein
MQAATTINNPQQSEQSCNRSNCPFLKTVSYYPDGNRIVYRYICGKVGMIPGRLTRCPLEDDN